MGSDQIELDGPELQKPIGDNRIGSVRVFSVSYGLPALKTG
jgi:hypothetical protein